jgi:hypothetical protein
LCLNLIVQPRNEIGGNTFVYPAKDAVDVAVAAEEVTIVFANAGPVGKTQCRKENLSDILEAKIPVPRFVRKIEGKSECIVLPKAARETPLIKSIALQRIPVEDVGVVKLEIRARHGVLRSTGRIAVGQNDADFGLIEQRF